jgi:hypothetical protein
MKIELPALLVRGEIDLPLEEVLSEVAPRFLQYAVKRCAKAHGKEIVMEKHFCDGCGAAMGEKSGNTLFGKVVLDKKKVLVQAMLFFNSPEEADDLGDGLDICPKCWEKIAVQLFTQSAAKK